MDVLSELMALRKRVAELERIGRPVEAARVRPPGNVRVVRLNEATGGPGGGVPEPGRFWKGFQQQVDTKTGTGDSPFEVHAISKVTHTPWTGKFAQDVAVISLDHFEVILPTPGQMVFIKVAAISGGVLPGGVTAQFADHAATGAEPGVFSDLLPVLCSNHAARFLSVPPFKVDGVYPALHVFPTTDAAGASTIAGVDTAKGFFIAHVEPPGPEAHTYAREIKLGEADGLSREVSITLTVKVDASGRVTDFTATRSPTYSPPP